MNAVINPSILFITDAEWQNDVLRDHFLENITELIGYIETNDNILLYWNDDFESLLWEYPQKKPWAHDTDWSNQLVSILFNFFNTRHNIYIVDEAIFYDETIPNPASSYYPEVLKMMHYCIDKCETVFFITDSDTPDNVSFHCKCHQFQETPTVVRKLTDFYDIDSLIDDYWPQNNNESQKLSNLVSYASIIATPPSKRNNIQNDFEFSGSFIDEIMYKQPRKKKLITQIIKRLQMTEAQAKADGSLQDEWISTVNERRMRITGEPTSIRVHYIYGSNHKIIFIHYYREGEHDVGL